MNGSPTKTIPQANYYWQNHWMQFKKNKLGYFSFLVVILFCLTGIYAPFLASSKPLIVVYKNKLYFPLFRYFLYSEFFTKKLDIFFNIFSFILPLMIFFCYFRPFKPKWVSFSILLMLQFFIFFYLQIYPIKDPAGDVQLIQNRSIALKAHPQLDWNFDLHYMNNYAKLNKVLQYHLQKEQYDTLKSYLGEDPPTLFHTENLRISQEIERQKQLESNKQFSTTAKNKINYLQDRQKWLEKEDKNLQFILMPPLSHFHWEDDAGGQQSLNQQLPWWELTRINRKDLLSALIFGIRISLVIGLLSVAIALTIAIPIGSIAGFYGGKADIIVSRLLEIWEAMPTFFMLLMVVAILQSKSIFIVIAIIGFFGWTSFSRYLRGEFFKQRNLPYVEACKSLGYSNPYIMFLHILPNAMPPLLTLLPFAIMGAISSEAGLSFLGLGEENSCSWGVLMDEGRSAFPAESNLLWPPAILLTTLLVAIALVGDALRDTFDPKMHKI